MQFANIKQLNLILDIVLDFVMDCYILWNMKILLMIKLCIAIKKILNVYGNKNQKAEETNNLNN